MCTGIFLALSPWLLRSVSLPNPLRRKILKGNYNYKDLIQGNKISDVHCTDNNTRNIPYKNDKTDQPFLRYLRRHIENIEILKNDFKKIKSKR